MAERAQQYAVAAHQQTGPHAVALYVLLHERRGVVGAHIRDGGLPLLFVARDSIALLGLEAKFLPAVGLDDDRITVGLALIFKRNRDFEF